MDLLIIGILGILVIKNNFYQGSYFIFYSIFLFCASLSLNPKTKYKSIPISIFLAWSLIMVFVHKPYQIVPNSIINSYINISIMFEGFIYILAGCLLFLTIVKCASNARMILLSAFTASIPIIWNMFALRSEVSILLAFAITLCVYLVANKYYKILGLILFLGGAISVLHWSHFVNKASTRPLCWIATFKEIAQHPFVGRGFSNTIMSDGLLYVEKLYWVYRHNDFLMAWSALGIVAFITLVWFVISSLKTIGKSVYLIPFLTIILLCNFKEMMLLPDKATVCIVIGACCVRATIKKERI